MVDGGWRKGKEGTRGTHVINMQAIENAHVLYMDCARIRRDYTSVYIGYVCCNVVYTTQYMPRVLSRTSSFTLGN